MNPPVSWIGEGFCGNSIEQQFHRFTCPEEGPNGAPIKMIHRHGGSFISTMTETNKWVQMYQHPNLEFVVMQDCHWQSETKFGDVILPASTNFEHSDLSEWGAAGGYGFNDFNSNHRVCIYQHKCIEPLWESKPDYEIYTLLAERLGFKEEYTEGHNIEDWNRIVFDKSDLPKYVTYEEFKEKGYFVVPCHAGRRGAPGLVPLVLRRPGRRRVLGAEEPAEPAAQRPQPGHAQRQGGVRLPDPHGLRPGRRGAAAHGPLHPELGGLRHQGPGGEVAAADDLAASRGSRITRTTTTRATGWTTSRSTASRRTATRTGRCASTRRTRRRAASRTATSSRSSTTAARSSARAIVTERMRPGHRALLRSGGQVRPAGAGRGRQPRPGRLREPAHAHAGWSPRTCRAKLRTRAWSTSPSGTRSVGRATRASRR